MAFTVDLYVNTGIDAAGLITPTGAEIGRPIFTEGDVVNMTIQLLKPDPANGSSAFTVVDISGMSLKMAVGPTPTGSSGGPTPYVTQFTWSKDTTNMLFFATVAFNTTELATAMGSAASLDCTMELEITEGTTVKTVFQGVVRVLAELIESATTSVAAGQTPLSLETAMATFAKLIGLPGETITLTSSSYVAGVSGHARVLGANDDGTAADYII